MANIKGFFTKVRNLKKEDIKEHFKKRKERRQMILEKRRNGKFAKKMQPVYKWMNRLSVPLQFLLACIINFFIEVNSNASERTFKSCALKGVTRFVSRYPLQIPKNSQNTLSNILVNTRLRTR